MKTALSFYDSQNLYEQMENQISELPYPALERLLVLLMKSMNYAEIRVVDGGNPRGYSKFGGMSIIARSRGPIQDSLTLVQVKQISVQRRYIDELRGAMLRWGANQGIIFSSARIPDRSRFCADLFPGRPIRLISRRQMAKLLIAKGIGVRTTPLSIDNSEQLVIDELFFELLNESNQRRI